MSSIRMNQRRARFQLSGASLGLISQSVTSVRTVKSIKNERTPRFYVVEQHTHNRGTPGGIPPTFSHNVFVLYVICYLCTD